MGVKSVTARADPERVTDLDLRCPQCAALVRHGTQWCTLCHADLRPAPAVVEAESVPEPVTALDPDAVIVPVLDPFEGIELDDVEIAALLAPVTPRTGAKHGKHAKRPVAPAGSVALATRRSSEPAEPAATAADDPTESADGLEGVDDPEIMLALLRGESRDPTLERLQGRLSDPAVRIGVIIGGTLGVGAVLFVTFTVIGALLH